MVRAVICNTKIQRLAAFPRTKKVPSSPRPTPCSAPLSIPIVRCFSRGSGGGDGDNSEKRTHGDEKKKTKKVSQDIWMEQQQEILSRRSRFGPKSQKYFQAALNPPKRYGIRSLNLKLVKDSSEIPILIPGRDIQENSTKSESNDDNKKSGQGRRRRRKLPIVNASALLDTASYCKTSAKPSGVVTKSGTEAAKRLLRGKKDLVDMLRGQVVFQQNFRVCLAGHGVPQQLLQDHINFADSILQRCDEPVECSFSYMKHSGGSDPYPDCMRIRGHDGKSRLWAWPPPPLTQRELIKGGKSEYDENAKHTWEERLALYLAVMDRIANKLGLVGSYLQKETRKQWSVKIYRGMAYPLELISRPDGEEDNGPVPILEWSPLNRVSKKPHVSIRIQGLPDSPDGSGGSTKRDAVTLVYDALFQGDPRLEPVAAS